jgi:heme exporter protein C
MAAAILMALFFAGTDAQQGNVQRIFYMHVGSFTGGATAFFITLVASIVYIRTRNPKWDRLALAGVEMGLPMMTINLLTGAIWARPIWNTWWTSDDPRLNSMAVLWLLYAAYLTLRGAVDNAERRQLYAAIYGIFIFVSVIYVFLVIRFRTDTLHPVVFGPSPTQSTAKGGFGVAEAAMIWTISVSSIGWMLAAFTLVWHRVRVENIADRVRTLKLRVMSQ